MESDETESPMSDDSDYVFSDYRNLKSVIVNTKNSHVTPSFAAVMQCQGFITVLTIMAVKLWIYNGYRTCISTI